MKVDARAEASLAARAQRCVGVLAIQGSVAAHARALESVGARARPVLRAADLEGCDALILPGGESTTIAQGLERLQLWEPVRAFARAGRPVLGTCAGAILLAREVAHAPVPTLALLDLRARRNAYGTQVNSFAAEVDADAAPELRGFRCVFIRAPHFEAPGARVEVLARQSGRPVLVREGNVWASSFHPELAHDTRVHALWLQRA